MSYARRFRDQGIKSWTESKFYAYYVFLSVSLFVCLSPYEERLSGV